MEEILKGSPIKIDIELTPNADIQKWSDYENAIVWVFVDKAHIAKCSIVEREGYGMITVASDTLAIAEVLGDETAKMNSGKLWIELYNEHEDKMLSGPGRSPLNLKLVDCHIKEEAKLIVVP